MSSNEEEASHVIVVAGIHRLGESPFLEVEMPTMGSASTDEGGNAPQIQQLERLWNAA